MAMVIAPLVTDATQVRPSNNNFNKQESSITSNELDISKVIPECIDESALNQENVEKEIVYNDVSSNVGDACCEREVLQDEASISSSVENNYSENGIDKTSKDGEIITNDKLRFDKNNDGDAVKEVSSERLLHLVDSDSEEETNLNGILNKESSAAEDDCSSESLENKSERNTVGSESEDDTVHKTADTTTNRYRALIDSESEEDAHNSPVTCDNADTSKVKSTREKSLKKRKGSIRASKNEAMHKIHSETQRLLRETEISLPYHRPKQRTLQEFLNRNKVLAALPKAPSAAAKLKMSSEIVSQVLAEKEKGAELFYKSSDSEDDALQSSVCKNEKNCFVLINEKMSSTDSIHVIRHSVRDKSKTNNQDAHDKNEILQKDEELPPERTENNANQDGESKSEENKRCPLKTSVVKNLFDTTLKNKTDGISDISYNQHETINTNSLGEEKHINNKELEVSRIENNLLQISKTHRYDIEINESNGNEDKKKTKISEIFCDANDKRTIDSETSNENHCATNKCVFRKSDDCVVMQDDKNEKTNNNCIETDNISLSAPVSNVQSQFQDNLLTEKCKKFDDHVLGLPLPNFTDESLISREKLSMKNSKTLIGSPGTFIDLTYDAKATRKGVKTLLNRFFYKHVNTKRQTDNKSEITVIHVQDTQNGPVPIKETLPYKLPVNTDNSELNKPGAKLLRLKENLKLQMTIKRNKEWKQKEIELQTQEKEMYGEEESDCDLEKIDNLELSDSGESEPEENDICIKDKKRRKCLFADDEAEVTDDENSDVSIEEISDNESDVDEMGYEKHKSKREKGHINDDTNEIEEVDREEGENLNTGIEESETDFKNEDNDNIYKDIVGNINDGKTDQSIRDDSCVIDPKDLKNENGRSKNIAADVDKTHREDSYWISEDEDTTRSQLCKTPLKARTSMLDFVSPVTQLSVLNVTLDTSNKKDTSKSEECLVDEHEFVSIENTQQDSSLEHAYTIRNKTISQKKLFDDIEETIDDEYLKQLCSGKFGTTQKTDLSSQAINSDESQLYSGNLNNMQLIDTKALESAEMEKEISQDLRLTLDEDSSDNSVNRVKEINAPMEKLIKVAPSSDEDQESDKEDTFLKRKNRPVKRLNLSDSEEENASSDESYDEENNDINDEETEDKYIDYDSEENEVVVVPKKDMRKIAANFLEEEAELSESDWDSADEDEKDLDKLEFEEADDEHIDEDEMKDQLEKIHMKQILDEDKREVRMLKELLFEDGDLHTDGAGRERKFKWKNIDKLGNSDEMPQLFENDGWVDAQEDEEEAKWNKLRHERDKFLEERMKSSSNKVEDELNDSQIFKFGLEAIKKIKSNEFQKQDTLLDEMESSENMEPIMPRNLTDLLNGPNIGKKSQTIYNFIKRRSLLTRGEESLAKIASLAKQGDPVSHTANARNFVFQYIDPRIDNVSKEQKGESIDSSEEAPDSQNKPRKRKMTSKFSQRATKKRRK